MTVYREFRVSLAVMVGPSDAERHGGDWLAAARQEFDDCLVYGDPALDIEPLDDPHLRLVELERAYAASGERDWALAEAIDGLRSELGENLRPIACGNFAPDSSGDDRNVCIACLWHRADHN